MYREETWRRFKLTFCQLANAQEQDKKTNTDPVNATLNRLNCSVSQTTRQSHVLMYNFVKIEQKSPEAFFSCTMLAVVASLPVYGSRRGTHPKSDEARFSSD